MDSEHKNLLAQLERLLQDANARPNRPLGGMSRSDWVAPHENGPKSVGEIRFGLFRYSVHADCSREAIQTLIDGIRAGKEVSRVPGPRGADKLGLDGQAIVNLQIYVT